MQVVTIAHGTLMQPVSQSHCDDVFQDDLCQIAVHVLLTIHSLKVFLLYQDVNTFLKREKYLKKFVLFITQQNVMFLTWFWRSFSFNKISWVEGVSTTDHLHISYNPPWLEANIQVLSLFSINSQYMRQIIHIIGLQSQCIMGYSQKAHWHGSQFPWLTPWH